MKNTLHKAVVNPRLFCVIFLIFLFLSMPLTAASLSDVSAMGRKPADDIFQASIEKITLTIDNCNLAGVSQDKRGLEHYQASYEAAMALCTEIKSIIDELIEKLQNDESRENRQRINLFSTHFATLKADIQGQYNRFHDNQGQSCTSEERGVQNITCHTILVTHESFFKVFLNKITARPKDQNRRLLFLGRNN